MEKIQKRMIRRALRKHKRIYPCANRDSLEQCFTSWKNRMVLWYNTDDQTTHAMYERE